MEGAGSEAAGRDLSESRQTVRKLAVNGGQGAD